MKFAESRYKEDLNPVFANPSLAFRVSCSKLYIQWLEQMLNNWV